MTSLVYQLTFLVSISLFIISCSSDPCETVTCVNGACNEGMCECEEGYKGVDCSEIDLKGVYFNSDLVWDDHFPQSYKDTLRELIGEKRCNNESCNSFLYEFLGDGNYIRKSIHYVEDANGNFFDDHMLNWNGTYSINGNEITILNGIDKDVMFRYQKDKLTGQFRIGECYATRHFTKRKE
ncbi:MAG: hypothetical protein ACI9FN_001831 [Saprospiraceae bacterium]|jgi:hypothetical protein